MELGFLCPMETDRSLTIIDHFLVLPNKLPPSQQKKRDGCGLLEVSRWKLHQTNSKLHENRPFVLKGRPRQPITSGVFFLLNPDR